MTEWVRHYRAEGVSQFVLVDDESTDDGAAIARALGCTVVPRGQTTYQSQSYEQYARLLTTQWMLIADLDEFVFARAPATLASYLAAHAATACGSISVPWTMFGSSNASSHPFSLVDSNRHRLPTQDIRMNVKTFVRVADLCAPNAVDTHSSFVSSQYCTSTDPPSAREGVHFSCADWRATEGLEPAAGESLASLQVRRRELSFHNGTVPDADHVLQLNHYIEQSWEYYCKIKVNRGNANQDNERTAPLDFAPAGGDGVPPKYTPAWYTHYNGMFSGARDDALADKRGRAFIAELPRTRAWPKGTYTAELRSECERAYPQRRR